MPDTEADRLRQDLHDAQTKVAEMQQQLREVTERAGQRHTAILHANRCTERAELNNSRLQFALHDQTIKTENLERKLAATSEQLVAASAQLASTTQQLAEAGKHADAASRELFEQEVRRIREAGAALNQDRLIFQQEKDKFVGMVDDLKRQHEAEKAATEAAKERARVAEQKADMAKAEADVAKERADILKQEVDHLKRELQHRAEEHARQTPRSQEFSFSPHQYHG